MGRISNRQRLRLKLNRARLRGDVLSLAFRYRLFWPAASIIGAASFVALCWTLLETLGALDAVGLSPGIARWQRTLDVVVPYLWAIIVVVAVTFIVYSSWYYHSRRLHHRIIPLAAQERSSLRRKISLPGEMTDAGFEIRSFLPAGADPLNEELYVLSDRTNAHLRTHAREITLDKMSGRFRLPTDVRTFVPAMLHQLARGDRIVYNGRLMGLRSEVYPGSSSLSIQEARYLEAQSTDESIYLVMREDSSIEPKLRGSSLVLDDEHELRPLSLTAVTNHVGVSCIVVTRDNVIYFQRQGQASNTNAGRLAPSGSGSVDLADWQRAFEAAGSTPSLRAVLVSAAEREFYEEFGLRLKAALPITSTVIGYARLVERGGKPDFFVLSRLDMTAKKFDDLLAHARLGFKESGLSVDEKYRVNAAIGLVPAMEAFLRNGEKHSIQNAIFADILRGAARDDSSLLGDPGNTAR